MANRTLAIGIAADRLDMLSCRGGRVLARHRIAINLDSDPQRWTKTLKDCAKAVRSGAERIGAAGLRTTVFYQSPTQSAEYMKLALRSAGDAREAAILACAESLTCPPEQAVSRALVVGRSIENEQAHSHVVVASDHDETLNAIAWMLEEAGLPLAGAVPLDAMIMAGLVSRTLRTKEPRVARLYMGEHRSFFLASDRGALLFGRPINLGVEALVASLARPIHGAGPMPIELTPEGARDVLLKYGFSTGVEVVHPRSGLTARQMIPQLQPVVQRLIVELRQSLRFSMPEEARQSVRISVCGPGSMLPGFVPILGEELRLNVAAEPGAGTYEWQVPGSAGSDLDQALRARSVVAHLGLQPLRLERKRQSHRLNRWLWTGAAAALVAIAVDSTYYRAQLSDARRQLQAIESFTPDVMQMHSRNQRMVGAIIALRKLENASATEVGAALNLRAIMQEISHITPEAVRITSLSLAPGGGSGQISGSISGLAIESPFGSGRTQLQGFIERLRASPLFLNVSLSNVQVASLRDVSGERFEARFAAVPAPRSDYLATMNAAGMEPTQ